MRLTDADALKEKYTMVTKRYSGGIMERPAVLLETIDEAPSIDICFCRECKYFWKYSDLPTKCVFHLSLVNSDDFCSYGCREEKPNNCEHITEDGVTCAKYPACDDCLDNPLNKVKGSERLVKGSEQTDCQTCKWWSNYGYCVHRECKGYVARKGESE